ncbi:hypothetical protein [Streptomyces sp. NPDC000851]
MPRPTKRDAAQDLVNRIRALMLAGDTDAAESLYEDAEEAIAACRPQDRKALAKSLEEAFTVEPAALPAISSYHEVEGVDTLVNEGISKVRRAVDQGLETADMARQVAETLLQARLKMRNKHNLPDIVAQSKYTKNIAHDTFVKAREGVTEEDVHRWATHKSLAKAVRNRMSDVVVAHLRSLDEDPETCAALYPQAKARFPDLSPTESVYALYASVGVDLPRKGRTEVAREYARQRAQLVAKAVAGELPPGEDEDEGEELAHDMAALERVERSFVRAAKRAEKLSPEQRAALKARLNEMITNLAAQAAAL